MEIKDWWIARELDVHAAVYVQSELIKREVEREKRDRDFWTVMFGGEASQSDSEITLDALEHRTLPQTDDEVIARSRLGRR